MTKNTWILVGVLAALIVVAAIPWLSIGFLKF